MIGNITRGGVPIVLGNKPTDVAFTRGASGRYLVPVVRSPHMAYMTAVPFMMTNGRGQFYQLGREYEELPNVSGADESAIIDAHRKIEEYARLAAETEQRIAQVQLKFAQLEHARANAALAEAESIHGIGSSFWDKVKDTFNKATSAVTSAASNVQSAAQSTYSAAKQAATNAAAAASNPQSALKQAVASAKKIYDEAKAKAQKTINSVMGSPLKKAIACFTLLPPPANAIAAAEIVRKNKTAVLNDLPASVRDFIGKLESNLDGMLSGIRESVGDAESINVNFHGSQDHTVGDWASIKGKIAAAWDRQSKGTKTAIIAILVVAIIVAIIVAIYSAGAGAVPAGSGVAGAGTSVATPGFFAAVGGWPTVGGLITTLFALFKSKPGAPPAVAAAPAVDPPVPSPVDQALLTQEYKDTSKSGVAGALKVALPLAGAAALLL